MKKLMVVVLALAMVLSMNAVAFASYSDGEEYDYYAPTTTAPTTTAPTTTAPTATSTTTSTTADGTKVETTTMSDGSTVATATKTDADGTSQTAVTTTAKDGSVETVAEVKVSEKAASAGEVTLAVEVAAEAKTEIKIDVPATVKEEITVNVPVKNVDMNTVAVVVKPDGTEQIICATKKTADGVAFDVDKDCTIKIINNEKTFEDIKDSDWESDGVKFVSSREIFKGVEADTFAPQDSITREMAFTVLARYAGNNNAEYADATAWAKAAGITNGANVSDEMTREELATILYRYAGAPETKGSLAKFADAKDVSGFAVKALQWCIENGIINGVEGSLLPGETANRAELATIIMRFCNAL